MIWGIIGGIVWFIGGFISVGMINYYFDPMFGPMKRREFDSISISLYCGILLVFVGVIGGPFASFSVICVNLMFPKKDQRWGFKL